MTSFNHNHLLKGPISKYSHTGGYGFEHMILWGYNSVPNTPLLVSPEKLEIYLKYEMCSFVTSGNYSHRVKMMCRPKEGPGLLASPWLGTTARVRGLWCKVRPPACCPHQMHLSSQVHGCRDQLLLTGPGAGLWRSGAGLSAPARPRWQKTQQGPGQDTAQTRFYVRILTILLLRAICTSH